MKNLKTILIAAGTALALTTGAASAADYHHDRDHHATYGRDHHDYDRDHHDRDRHDYDRDRHASHGDWHRHMIARDRVYNVFRDRHIRYVGAPYLYNGYYVARCYDAYGRLEYCRVDPYTGAFIGFSIRL
ncbi:MAG: hypothetical protein ACREHE_10885 [Rhizomicrobium sp.]